MPGVTLERGLECVRVRIPMKMRRRGGRKVILVPDGLRDLRPMKSEANIPLAAAVARGHEWQEMFLSGQYDTIAELAEKVGVDKSFVTRMMRLALLAPDIVDAIMDGREPDGLTFKDLTVKPVPLSWDEQRRRWRFREISWKSGMHSVSYASCSYQACHADPPQHSLIQR